MLKPEQQAKLRAEAEKAIDDYTAKFKAQEKDVVEFFKGEGKKVYTPDLERLPHLRPEELPRQVRQRLAEGCARADQRVCRRALGSDRRR